LGEKERKTYFERGNSITQILKPRLIKEGPFVASWSAFS
jgi:hypothetical protein